MCDDAYAVGSTAPIVKIPSGTGSSMWFSSTPQTALVKVALDGIVVSGEDLGGKSRTVRTNRLEKHFYRHR
jgi:hypothetical protein